MVTAGYRREWVILRETVRDRANELVLSSNMPKLTRNEWIHWSSPTWQLSREVLRLMRVHKHALFFLFRLTHTCSKFLFLHKRSHTVNLFSAVSPLSQIYLASSGHTHAHTLAVQYGVAGGSVQPAVLIAVWTDGAHDTEPRRPKVGCYSSGELKHRIALCAVSWSWSGERGVRERRDPCAVI